MNIYEDEDRVIKAKSLEESLEVLEMLLSNGYSVWENGSRIKGSRNNYFFNHFHR